MDGEYCIALNIIWNLLHDWYFYINPVKISAAFVEWQISIFWFNSITRMCGKICYIHYAIMVTNASSPPAGIHQWPMQKGHSECMRQRTAE